MGGVFAREQVKKVKLNLEEAIESTFSASLFRNLGKRLSIYKFPGKTGKYFN